MSKPPSNTRRFVNAAWSLLTFQVIAAVGAVGVTGWAAFHVQRLAANQTIEPARVEPAIPVDGAAQTAPATSPDAKPAEPEQAQAEPSREPVIPACPRVENLYRIPAQMGWCDTGLVLQQGQLVALRAQGRWSNAGDPQYGPEGIAGYQYPGTIVSNAALASLVGQVGDAAFPIGGSPSFTSPSTGPLYLSINDTPGTFGDNQGSLEIYLDVPLLQ